MDELNSNPGNADTLDVTSEVGNESSEVTGEINVGSGKPVESQAGDAASHINEVGGSAGDLEVKVIDEEIQKGAADESRSADLEVESGGEERCVVKLVKLIVLFTCLNILFRPVRICHVFFPFRNGQVENLGPRAGIERRICARAPK